MPWRHVCSRVAHRRGDHTAPLLDLRGSPSFIHISDSKLHDVNVLDPLIAEPDSFNVTGRAYLDFARPYALGQAGTSLFRRASRNMCAPCSTSTIHPKS